MNETKSVYALEALFLQFKCATCEYWTQIDLLMSEIKFLRILSGQFQNSSKCKTLLKAQTFNWRKKNLKSLKKFSDRTFLQTTTNGQDTEGTSSTCKKSGIILCAFM